MQYQVNLKQLKRKSVEKIRSAYDEIINKLLNEREEAVRIVISTKDIQYLYNTVLRILESIKGFQISKAKLLGEGRWMLLKNR